MKRTIISATMIFAILTSVIYFTSSEANASETRKTSGFLVVHSSYPGTGGVYCGSSSGSFTTGVDGGAKILVPNGTYTVCVGSSHSVSGVVVNNNFVDVYVDDGGSCPCGN